MLRERDRITVLTGEEEERATLNVKRARARALHLSLVACDAGAGNAESISRYVIECPRPESGKSRFQRAQGILFYRPARTS